MKFRPVGDRVLVKLLPKEEGILPSGLIKVEKNEQKQRRGVIEAVGVGGTNQQGQPKLMLLKVGETVLTDIDFGAKVELGGTDEHYVFEQDNIIGVLDDD